MALDDSPETAAARQRMRERLQEVQRELERMRAVARRVRMTLEATVPILPPGARAQTAYDADRLTRHEANFDHVAKVLRGVTLREEQRFDAVTRHRLSVEPHLAASLQTLDNIARPFRSTVNQMWGMDGMLRYHQQRASGFSRWIGLA